MKVSYAATANTWDQYILNVENKFHHKLCVKISTLEAANSQQQDPQ